MSGAKFGGQTLTSNAPTLSSVASSVSAVTLLAANVNRKGALIYNESTAILYLGLCPKASVSTTNYTLQIAAGGYYEVPAPISVQEISGVWSLANGSARITELT